MNQYQAVVHHTPDSDYVERRGVLQEYIPFERETDELAQQETRRITSERHSVNDFTHIELWKKLR